MNIDDMIELARRLATLDPGRPKQVLLRRSVSTAYYAIFHALAKLSADTLVGGRKPCSVYTPIYRSLEHSIAKRVFERSRSDKSLTNDLRELGRIFILLQEARSIADYDPTPFSHGRREVLALVREAQRGVQILEGLSPEDRLRLAVMLVARTR